MRRSMVPPFYLLCELGLTVLSLIVYPASWIVVPLILVALLVAAGRGID